MALNIEWSSMTLTEHGAVMDVLTAVHAHTISRMRVGEGIDNRPLLDLAVDINKSMHAGNDDLARREHRMSPVTGCDCGVCP